MLLFTEQLLCQWDNQRWNQKIYKDKWKHGIPNSMGFSKNNTKWEVNSDKGIPQEQETWKSNNWTLYLKKLEKEC